MLEDWKFVPGGRILTVPVPTESTHTSTAMHSFAEGQQGEGSSQSGQRRDHVPGGGVGMNSLLRRHAYVKG